MKILLTAINAKFIHSSLAIRLLAQYASDLKDNIVQAEYTINNSEDYILTDIFSQKCDIICFSCYIWNIDLIISITKNLKKVMPKAFIICGGPEVSYESEDFLNENPQIDLIIRGEGEETFKQVAAALVNDDNFYNIEGITFKSDGQIISNPNRAPLSMDTLPFVYKDLTELENRIIYFETQRGCPYNCRFCLSSVEKGVRFLSLEKVYYALDFFLKNKVKQVKFVDRTFNCNKIHAHSIWNYIMENDNGTTNFHMEIEAHIVDEDTIKLLKKARNGLFQFEIGVQSTNSKTLSAVNRNPDFLSLKEKIKQIKTLENIHIHLDLIAGLPLENYSSFRSSFNDVYALKPHQLQLGFLKVLKGSGLKADAERFGIINRHQAPYEVLFTNSLSFDNMLSLKAVEEMTEIYLNSAKALKTINYAAELFPTPFDFFQDLGNYWINTNNHRVNHSKQELYNIFYSFCLQSTYTKHKIENISQLLKLDMLLFDNLNTLLSWSENENTEEMKKIRRSFFSNKENIEKYIPSMINYSYSQLLRMCRLEKFKFDVLKNTEIEKDTFILFNYYKRDFLLNQAEFVEIEVES